MLREPQYSPKGSRADLRQGRFFIDPSQDSAFQKDVSKSRQRIVTASLHLPWQLHPQLQLLLGASE